MIIRNEDQNMIRILNLFINLKIKDYGFKKSRA